MRLLVAETREEVEYDRERALRYWALIITLIPYGEREAHGLIEPMSDDDRVICLYELLNGSRLAEFVFGGGSSYDCGYNLIERPDDA